MLIQLPLMKEVKVLIGRNEHDTKLFAGRFNLRSQYLGARPTEANQWMYYYAWATTKICHKRCYHLTLSSESHQDPPVFVERQLCCSLLMNFDPSSLNWDQSLVYNGAFRRRFRPQSRYPQLPMSPLHHPGEVIEQPNAEECTYEMLLVASHTSGLAVVVLGDNKPETFHLPW